MDLDNVIECLPQGYSEVMFQGRRYRLLVKRFNQGNSVKIYAAELGGKDVISANYYRLKKGKLLKPCEMPERKVIHFLCEHTPLPVTTELTREISKRDDTSPLTKIAFGGGCHWCTEAVFQSLRGVVTVEPGWISSEPPFGSFSEAVIVEFVANLIPLEVLIEIHLYTHAANRDHPLREKYRSAIYSFSEVQRQQVADIIGLLQQKFAEPIITRSLLFHDFRPVQGKHRNYYRTDPQRPFCQAYITPKLGKLMRSFARYVGDEKLAQLPVLEYEDKPKR